MKMITESEFTVSYANREGKNDDVHRLIYVYKYNQKNMASSIHINIDDFNSSAGEKKQETTK